MPSEIDRALRDFTRYTGDGLPNEPLNAPLPVGDPTSGVFNIEKSALRAAFNAELVAIADARTIAEGSISQTNSILAQVTALNAQAQAAAATAEAVSAGQDVATRAIAEAMDQGTTPYDTLVIGGNIADGDGGGFRANLVTDEADLVTGVDPVPSASVTLMLPMHGRDGLQEYRDVSPYDHAVTLVGDTHADAGQSIAGCLMSYFDGAADGLSVAQADGFQPQQDWMFEVYGVPDPSPSTTNWIAGQTEGANSRWHLVANTNGSAELEMVVGGTTVVSIQSDPGKVIPGQVNHFAVSWDATDVRLFINSEVVATSAVVAPDVALNLIDAPLQIGSDGIEHFQGWLGRLTIWSEARWTVGFDVSTNGQLAGPLIPNPRFNFLPAKAILRNTHTYVMEMEGVTPFQFGAVANANMTFGNGPGGTDLITGADDQEAFEAMFAYMGVKSAYGVVPRARYLVERLPCNAPEQFHGRGFPEIITKMEGIEYGSEFYRSGGGATGIIFSAFATESSGTGRGDRLSNALIGSPFWLNGKPEPVKGVILENCLFRSYNGGHTVKNRLALMGAHKDCADINCTDVGSSEWADRWHLMHWAGVGAGYGEAVQSSHHGENYRSVTAQVERSRIFGFYSSFADVTVSEPVLVGANSWGTLFVGDETNELTAGLSGRIAKGFRMIGGTLKSFSATNDDPIITIISTGTSPSRDGDAPETGGRKIQLDISAAFRDLTVVGSTNVNKSLIRANNAIGPILFDGLTVRDFAGQVSDIDRSEKIIVRNLDAVTSHPTNGLYVLRSRKCQFTGSLTSDNVTARPIRVAGATETYALGADVALNATEIILNSALTQDALTGQKILINGILHYVAQYAPTGYTHVQVTPIRVAATTGDPIVVPQLSDVTIDMDIRGGFIGALVDNAELTIKPGTTFEGGYRYNIDMGALSHLEWHGATSVGAGWERIATPAQATADIRVDLTATATIVGGRLGVEGDHALHNLSAPTSDPITQGRINVIGTRFESAITTNGEVTASGLDDVRLTACIGHDGQLLESA